MTLRQPFRSTDGLRRRTLAVAAIVSLAMALCAADVIARPRSWADQDTGATRQPSWMPFSLGDRTPNPAVARITAVEGNALAQGSGTLVDVRDQRGLIVTNWHVIRDAKGPIVATFPDGFQSAATVLKVDQDWDLAALLIWRPNAAPIAVSTTAPQPGDALTIAGYGSGDYRAVSGRCTQYVAPGANMPYEMVEVSAEARQGDSGGPILNEQGELAGVLFGAGGGTTSGSFCGRVRWFLDSAWPPEPTQVGETFVAVPAMDAVTPKDEPVYAPVAEWPTDRLVDVLQPSTRPERASDEPNFNYSTGSALTPRTNSFDPTAEVANATTLDFNTLAGTTPVEQAKTILAAIGIIAVALQFSRLLAGNGSQKNVSKK